MRVRMASAARAPAPLRSAQKLLDFDPAGDGGVETKAELPAHFGEERRLSQPVTQLPHQRKSRRDVAVSQTLPHGDRQARTLFRERSEESKGSASCPSGTGRERLSKSVSR